MDQPSSSVGGREWSNGRQAKTRGLAVIVALGAGDCRAEASGTRRGV